MKKLLLCGVAALAITAAAPAKAEGIDLGLGGYFIGYGLYNGQDEAAGDSIRSFDFRKETEIHFNGETTLDNGLTVGGHVELAADRAADAGEGTIEESYAYFSGGWGRVNFGEEDGASYLLQVAAPSADDNIDGLRPDLNTLDTATFPTGVGSPLDYAADATGYANKITYITPLFSGFQAAASFTPDVTGDNASATAADDDDDVGVFNNAWEVAGRYQGTFQAVDLTLGAGYQRLTTEEDAVAATAVASEARDVMNAGVRVGFGAFGLGGAYVQDDNGVETDGDTTTWVAGADYTTGPFKVGVSYLDREAEVNVPGVGPETDADRWTAGVGYQYGPGMSLNGSVSRVSADAGAVDADATQVAIGTRVDF